MHVMHCSTFSEEFCSTNLVEQQLSISDHNNVIMQRLCQSYQQLLSSSLAYTLSALSESRSDWYHKTLLLTILKKCPRLSPTRPKHTESLSQSYVWCMIYREHIFEALLTTLLMVLQWLNISFYHIHCRYLETVGNLLIMVLLEFLMVSKSIFGLLLRWWMSFFGTTQSRWYFILFVCTHQAWC